ncbi:MAG: NAD(P)H-hydrate dehydratase [Hyphomicrobiales bacterium]|nr:NAD(P)H-hydrate dehydratase [Hyphomicrobiales bacterium]
MDLLTTAEMAEADRLTVAGGLPGAMLMEAAGAAVADRAAAMLAKRGRGRVLVLCGPGANGGDGYVAARLLAAMGFSTQVAALGDPSALRGDAANAARGWSGPVEKAETIALEADLVVDALFGAGLARPLEGAAAALVARVNDWRSRGGAVLAVDIPSGVDGTTGAVRGAALQADETVSFFRLKPGHLLMPGRALCGLAHLAEIGIDAGVLETIQPRAFRNLPGLWRVALPGPRIDAHKYARGHAVAVSGGLVSTGAGRLAARGALRAGAGLVSVASPPDALTVNAAHLTAIMLIGCASAQELARILADRRKNAVVLGPGLGVGETTCALAEAALASGAHVTLDADALTSFSGAPERLFAAIAAAPGAVVATPHAGEFARLFGAPQGSKLDSARRAAARSGATIVFKGPDSVAAAPDGRASIAANAPPWLATAGSGDVLAGMVCGLMAQGAPAFEAASAAVWMHGEAGALCGPGLIAEDLPEALPAVWRALLGDRV